MTTDGNLLVAVKEPNAIYEVDVASRELLWSWSPEVDGGFKMRDANRLPNGNILITSIQSILEITPDGEVAWRLDADLDVDGSDAVREQRPFFKTMLIDPDRKLHGS